MAERNPDYLRAAASDRDEVRARLAAEAASMVGVARSIGVLEIEAPVSGASFQPADGVYYLPVFSPGSTISLAPTHQLRLANAEAAYRLAMDSPAAQAMRSAEIQPARVRLLARIDGVRPTLNGSEFTGTLQSFTLLDKNGAAIGDSVSMTGTAAG